MVMAITIPDMTTGCLLSIGNAMPDVKAGPR